MEPKILQIVGKQTNKQINNLFISVLKTLSWYVWGDMRAENLTQRGYGGWKHGLHVQQYISEHIRQALMLDLHRCDPVKGTEMHFSVSKTTKLLFCTDKRSGLSAWRLQHAVYPLAYLDVGCQPEFSFYFQNQPPFLEMISLKGLAEPACTFPCKTYTPL